MMKIGPRTLKTGIAVTLSLMVADFLKIDGPIYAVIAAIIVMQPSVTDSWQKGVDRILGTIMGAIAGAIFVSISPGNPLLAGIGTIVLILIMNKLQWGEAIVIGTVVFIGIFIGADTGYVKYAFHRTMDTSLGIIIAVIINYIIYPPDYYGKVMEETKRNFMDILKYSIRTLEVLLYEDDERMDILENQIQRIEEVLITSEKLLEIQEKEKKVIPKGDIKYKEMLISHRLEKEIFQHLQNVQDVLEKGIKLEVVDVIRKELCQAKDLLISLHTREKNLYDMNKEENESLSLQDVIAEVQKAKVNIKNKEDINSYSTDEIVKMLVFLYNIEEVLLKLNTIICC